MFQGILVTHVLGALFMAIISVHAILAIIRGAAQGLADDARALSVLLFIQLLSGSSLGLLSTSFSPLYFCENISIYLGAYLVVEFAILFSLRRQGAATFPLRLALVSVCSSLLSPLFVVLVRMPLFY
jgi:hypothetical protein